MSLLTTIHIILGLLMAMGILLQHRAAGLSATFGGSGVSFVQRRGAEKVIYRATVWIAVVFFALSVVRWYL